MVTFLLVMVGALNWGLVGLLRFNLVETVLGSWPGLVMVVYVLVGASAVYEFATHQSRCNDCARMMGKK
jgi:hypothetical protein